MGRSDHCCLIDSRKLMLHYDCSCDTNLNWKSSPQLLVRVRITFAHLALSSVIHLPSWPLASIFLLPLSDWLYAECSSLLLATLAWESESRLCVFCSLHLRQLHNASFAWVSPSNSILCVVSLFCRWDEGCLSRKKQFRDRQREK